MNQAKKYKGVIVPAITPLTPDYQLDHKAVEAMFSNFYNYGVSPFILGTTGEAASIPFEVKNDYLLAAGKNKIQGTFLYAGISSNVFNESVLFAKACADNGVDAVAATLPSYYTLTTTQMKKYFEQLADAVCLPLVIYNIPATTHMSIPLDIIDELSYHPNIVATKDSERSEERLAESLELWKSRDDFSHFMGWAAKSVDALFGGSDGLIPSTGNLVPKLYAAMLKAVEEENFEEADRLQEYSDICGDLYQKGKTLGESLWALKRLMQQQGLCEAIVMPPLQPMSAQEEKKLIQTYNDNY